MVNLPYHQRVNVFTHTIVNERSGSASVSYTKNYGDLSVDLEENLTMADMFAVSYWYTVFAGSKAMAVPGQAVKYPVVLVIQRLSAVKVSVVLLALFSLLKPLQSLIE